ncbi:hypothetical protein OIU78_004472 [Salix suchowensis]|nr:hypothetical protein OIU78_004472 [Salix suchowensis]
MAKSKRGSQVLSLKSAPGPGTSTAREVDGSPVDNTTASLDGVLEEGCSEEEELGEEQLDFSCSEEDYPPPSSPAPVASDIPASSTPVVPVPPARPKGATFTPSSSVQVDNPAVPPPVNGKWRDMFSSNRNISSCPKLMHFSALHDTESCPLLTEDLDHSCDDWKLCAIGYVSGKFPGYRALNNIIKNAEARTVKKADPANVASEENIKDKGSVFTRLNPVVDSLVDDSPAAAPPVESSPDATPPVDAPELDAPSVPSESCVAQDVQPRPQVTTASSKEWQTVCKRRHSSRNKRQTPTPSPADCNPTPQHNVYSPEAQF